jgi:hypothetical protein
MRSSINGAPQCEQIGFRGLPFSGEYDAFVVLSTTGGILDPVNAAVVMLLKNR